MPRFSVTRQQIETLASLTQEAAARFLEMRPRTLRESDAPRNNDGSYDAIALRKWDRQRLSTPVVNGEEDELLAGSSSPALERYRLARAIAAERENEVAAGRLVDVAEYEQFFQSSIAAPLLRMVDTLKARSGPEAAEIAEQVLEEIAAAMESRNPPVHE
jgi:hypothetical protein